MRTKPITFLLALTFLFLFSGSSVVFADDYQDSKDAYKRKDYETAYKLIAPLAEQGHAKAQFNLGGMYANGYGVPQDYKEAVKWYRLAADRGLEHAQFNLGRVYYYGQGVSKDSVLAHMWWSLASSNGDKDAIDSRKLVEKEMSPSQIEKAQQLARNWKPSDRIKITKSPPFVSRSDFQDATDAYERNDYKEAYKIMLPLAKRGVAKGQYNLGLMYFKGKGVPQDYKEAVKWFRLSAEQEFGLAQYNLGFMYEKGHGVPQDYKEAVRLYRLSAEQGNAKGQYNLGLMYAEGQGVSKDNVLALMWWSLASSNGDKDAIYNRKQVETQMSPSQIEKAQEMARNWKLRDRIKIEKSPPSVSGSDLQDAVDAYKRNDYKEAIRLFRLSAEQGDAGGQYGLGGMYQNGKGVPQDYKEAVKWYRLSAKQGFADAQSNLGWMYYKGQGVSQDYVLAHMWFNLAGSEGYKDAVTYRIELANKMSPSQIEKAQQLARNWKPTKK